MDSWCRALLLCACLFWTSVTASEDDAAMGQFEVDLDQLMQEEDDMMQREVSLTELLEQSEMEEPDLMQREISLTELFKQEADPAQVDLVPRFAPRGRRPSFLVPQASPHLRYKDKVPFPPGRPGPANLAALCLHGARRPRYPQNYFGPSGYGQLRRRAEAVNRAEGAFAECCRGNQTWGEGVTLCCANQAWEAALVSFCKEEFSVKDKHHRCCKKPVGDRLACFQSEAPNAGYLPTLEVPNPTLEIPIPADVLPNPGDVLPTPLPFNPASCKRSEVKPGSVRGRKKPNKRPLPPPPAENVDINFPPGRPAAADVQPLCRYRKLRPRYDLKGLPRRGYGWLARQSKTVNRLERAFKQCCKGKGPLLSCVDDKWRQEMDRFCQEDKGGKVSFPCCAEPEGEPRYACFHARAPRPGYESPTVTDLLPPPDTDTDTTTPLEVSLAHVCQSHKVVKKKFPVGFPIQGLVTQCCSLVADSRTACIRQKLGKMSNNLCSSKKPSASPAVRQCCQPASPSSSSSDPGQCLADILKDAVTKATAAPHQRKRICPLSS